MECHYARFSGVGLWALKTFLPRADNRQFLHQLSPIRFRNLEGYLMRSHKYAAPFQAFDIVEVDQQGAGQAVKIGRIEILRQVAEIH